MSRHPEPAPDNRRRGGPPSGRPPSSHDRHAARRAVVGIARVWAVLITLLITTVALAFVPLGAGNLMVSMMIALLKAILIVTFYMHMRTASVWIRSAGLIGLFLISALFIITSVDYITRIPAGAPWEHREHRPETVRDAGASVSETGTEPHSTATPQ